VFPLWNPYLDTGHPFIADPMLHLYNPVVSLPVLLLGVWNGFKLALALSFILGALGMWWLGCGLGLGRWARLWLALMFAMAGQPVARFFQGQYLFIFGFAWIPWTFGSYIHALETGERSMSVLTAICFAMILFSGNAYYAFYTILALALFASTSSIKISRTTPILRIDIRKVRSSLWIALLMLGITAIQWLPLLQYRPYINKARDIVGSHTLWQIFLDLTSKDTFRPDAFRALPAREEYYAYIGWLPVLTTAFLPCLPWKQDRRAAPFMAILAASLLWISLEYMPWKEAFAQTEFLAQFRHLLRILIYVIFSVLVLAALVLDNLIKRLEKRPALQLPFTIHLANARTLQLGKLALIGAMALSTADLFFTHRPIIKAKPRNEEPYLAARWLRANDPGVYFVRHNPNNEAHDALISNQIRFMDAWYHFTEIRRIRREAWDLSRPIEPRPHYIVQAPEQPPPSDEGAMVVADVGGRRIYALPRSLPMAFKIPTIELLERPDAGPVTIEEISPVPTVYPTVNQIKAIVEAESDETLVLLTSYYPRWVAYGDGYRTSILNASGFIAVPLEPGTHLYEFVFKPVEFYLGVVVSLATTLVMISWLRRTRFVPFAPWGSILRRLTPSQIALWSQTHLRQYNRMPEAWFSSGGTSEGMPSEAEEPNPLEFTPKAETTEVSAHETEVAGRCLIPAIVARISWALQSPGKPTRLILVALLVYLAVRIIGLASFPIYFFSDEAVQTVLAADLVRDGFHGYDGVFLPTYFENASLFNLSLSVYLQVIPYLLFGKSVFVTRAVSVLIGMSGALAVGLLLRRAFGYRHAWAGVLVFSSLPAWFLHSRTAFETVIFVSMMAWVAYFYARYRAGELRHLYTSILFGALAFYSYRGGQLVILSFGALLFLFDIRHHWRHRRALLWGALLAIVLAVPYLRFELQHRQESYFQLRMLDTYWLHEIPLLAKLQRFVSLYLKGLSPRYWFWPNPGDLPRHLMKGYGHLPLFTLPFAALGLAIAARRVRDPAHRMILLLGLVSPLGGAMVDIGITRVLVFTLPAAILITLGLRAVCTPLARRWGEVPVWGSLFAFLIVVHGSMLGDALINGPTWYDNYGLGGMQYGARQVFTTVGNMLEAKPEQTIYVSPSWANGADILKRFFLPDEAPVHMSSAAPFLERRLPLDDHILFVLTLEEYQDVLQDPKIGLIEVHQTIPYPNGDPGFVFLSMGYSEEADALFAAEEAERQRPRTDVLELDEFLVAVTHPYFDMGGVEHLFDEDTFTLARVHSANPARFRLEFSRPRPLQGIRLTTGSMDFQVTLRAYDLQEPEPLEVVEAFRDLPDDPTVKVALSAPLLEVHAIEIEILSFEQGDPVKIHLREIELW